MRVMYRFDGRERSERSNASEYARQCIRVASSCEINHSLEKKHEK